MLVRLRTSVTVSERNMHKLKDKNTVQIDIKLNNDFHQNISSSLYCLNMTMLDALLD